MHRSILLTAWLLWALSFPVVWKIKRNSGQAVFRDVVAIDNASERFIRLRVTR
jgi:hypothetical protein